MTGRRRREPWTVRIAGCRLAGRGARTGALDIAWIVLPTALCGERNGASRAAAGKEASPAVSARA